MRPGDFHARRGREPSAQIPRIDHRGAGVFEIADVAGEDDQVMDDCGRGDQAIGETARRQCRNSSPFEGDLVGHAKNTVKRGRGGVFAAIPPNARPRGDRPSAASELLQARRVSLQRQCLCRRDTSEVDGPAGRFFAVRHGVGEVLIPNRASQKVVDERRLVGAKRVVILHRENDDGGRAAHGDDLRALRAGALHEF